MVEIEIVEEEEEQEYRAHWCLAIETISDEATTTSP
jgi:hypothetical protein